jgi:hypothetical protein
LCKLTTSAVRCCPDRSVELQYAAGPVATTRLNAKGIVARKLSSAKEHIAGLQLDDRVDGEQMVFCLLAWRQSTDFTTAPLPENVIVCNHGTLRYTLGPTLAHFVDALAPPK